MIERKTVYEGFGYSRSGRIDVPNWHTFFGPRWIDASDTYPAGQGLPLATCTICGGTASFACTVMLVMATSAIANVFICSLFLGLRAASPI
jgi:hypothetical protein